MRTGQTHWLGWRLTVLAAAGVTFGGHTVTHPLLTQLGDERVLEEVAGGQAWVAQLLGSTAAGGASDGPGFAYPTGDVDPRVRELTARAGVRLAWLLNRSLAGPGPGTAP